MAVSAKDGPIKYSSIAIFTGFFLIVGLAFPFSSPGAFFLNWHILSYVMNRYVYLALIALTLVFVLRNFDSSDIRVSALGAWILYFSAIIFLMVLDGQQQVNLSILYLLLFVAPHSIRACRQPVLLAVGAAISFNALYGAAGMLASRFRFSYQLFPIVPYIWDGEVRIGTGFYEAFSPALFFQTNAAGAIFGTAFCFFLYRLIDERRPSRLLPVVIGISLLGLLLTRSLSAMMVTVLLCLFATRGRILFLLIGALTAYVALIMLVPDGVLGLSPAYLQHKLNSSALVKLSLLADNLRRMAEDGVLAFILPGREPPAGTENSFIDMAYQFGLVQLLLFYGWCARSLQMFEDRARALLVFPLVLSFIQNSAFTTPSVVIFGLVLAIYGNKDNPSPREEDHSLPAA